MKASVFGQALGTSSRRVPRGHGGRHAAREHQRKLRTSRGSLRPRRTGTAKAAGINRKSAKSRCAREWGGWGQISEEGPGQNNPDRSEGPWDRAAGSARTEVLISASSLTQSRESLMAVESTKGDGTPAVGKASSESPALKPYRGKPAVRNFRGGDGNVGIIRSPVRAIALPDCRN